MPTKAVHPIEPVVLAIEERGLQAVAPIQGRLVLNVGGQLQGRNAIAGHVLPSFAVRFFSPAHPGRTPPCAPHRIIR
ncbi:hypothetical protein D3C71_1834380 [compost metagenome]